MPRSRATSTRSAPVPGHAFCRFVGGKGGVGKTTCAAALALASAAGRCRTLLVTTDPAPSLSDALRQPLTSQPRPVTGTRGFLHAVEIDARRTLGRWIADRRGALETIALRGTWLDRDDVASLLRLSLPGIDEIAALLEVSRHAAGGRYQCLVVDTAPTGHTLRMLAMPGVLGGVAAVFDHMQAKHRAVVEALRGAWVPDEADAVVADMERDAAGMGGLLRDPSRSAMTWVTLPEPMAIAESADAIEALQALGVAVSHVVVNRVTPRPDRACRWCEARRAFEAGALGQLDRLALPGPVRIAAVTARAVEPRGRRALGELSAELAGTYRASRRRGRPAGRVRARLPPPGAGPGFPEVPRPVRLLLFGGKGGVGKTTCAAAAAIRIAAGDRRRRVLLLSTDPAHSLGDVFGGPLGDVPRAIPGAPANLLVRELDALRGFAAVRARYQASVDALFDRLSRGSAFDAAHDRRVMRDLFDLAPPGIDELAAILDVTDALSSQAGDGDDLVVMDTAPSGHALRLLEMPRLVQDWVKALMKILLKYQPVAGLGEFGAGLLRISQGLGRLRALLADGDRTRFVAVSRAAALPRQETSRLLARVHALGIALPAVIVNAVGSGRCGYCRQVGAAQAREIRAIRRVAAARGARLVLAPATVPPPAGSRDLHAWRQTWTSA